VLNKLLKEIKKWKEINMNIDDFVFVFISCIALGILVFIALTLNDLVNLFRE